MQLALIHGVKARNKSKIPARILSCGFINSGWALITLVLNTIKGMLKTITITLPIAKFLLFKRFIEPAIEASDVNTGDPRRKVIRTRAIFSFVIPNIKHAIGIITTKGIWKKNQRANNFIKTINSKDKPLICIKKILPSLKSSW